MNAGDLAPDVPHAQAVTMASEVCRKWATICQGMCRPWSPN